LGFWFENMPSGNPDTDLEHLGLDGGDPPLTEESRNSAKIGFDSISSFFTCLAMITWSRFNETVSPEIYK
jgi:hypothetical protein